MRLFINQTTGLWIGVYQGARAPPQQTVNNTLVTVRCPPLKLNEFGVLCVYVLRKNNSGGKMKLYELSFLHWLLFMPSEFLQTVDYFSALILGPRVAVLRSMNLETM